MDERSTMRQPVQQIPLWRDERFWKVIAQGVAIAIAIAVVMGLLVNLDRNLTRLGIQFGFDFLGLRASFDIGETPISYDSSNSYARALLVGLVNSLRIAVSGIILTTLLGVTIGIARLSDNWLVRNLALVYVETIRNTPLLLQLLFWYFVIFISGARETTPLPAQAYLTNDGLVIPWLEGTSGTGIWLVLVLGGVVGAAYLWRWRTQVQIEQGVPGRQALWGTGAIALSLALAAMMTRRLPFVLDVPQWVEGTQGVEGGLRLSPEFAALLIGLTVYTASFIAEIVRGGIQSVPQGQWEAARALGLKPGLVMRLVIFPQALRVIVPPLNSQYLNLWKNSSLAIAIGYPDIYFVASTTFNQTGKAVEVMLLLMGVYLGISLVISLLMNLFNRSIQF